MKKLLLPLLVAFVALTYVACSENSIEAGLSGKFSFTETENTDNLSDEEQKIYCEELAKKLKETRIDSDEYARLKALYDEKCGSKDRDTYCKELLRKIEAAEKDSDEQKRLIALYREKCGDKTEETDCEALMRKINAAEPNSEEQAKLMALYREKCGKTINRKYYNEDSTNEPSRKASKLTRTEIKRERP